MHRVTSIYLNLHSSPQSRKRPNGTFSSSSPSFSRIRSKAAQDTVEHFDVQLAVPLKEIGSCFVFFIFFLPWLPRFACNFCSPLKKQQQQQQNCRVVCEPESVCEQRRCGRPTLLMSQQCRSSHQPP